MKHKFTKNDFVCMLTEIIKAMLPMIVTILILIIISGGLL